MNIAEQMANLEHKDHSRAYDSLNVLLAESECGRAVYAYLDTFVRMLASPHSYVRNRGLSLIAANARWDETGRIAGILDTYLLALQDKKPVTARTCLKGLSKIVQARPELSRQIGPGAGPGGFSPLPVEYAYLTRKGCRTDIGADRRCPAQLG